MGQNIVSDTVCFSWGWFRD